jgi:hypothetical protein
MNMKRPSHKEIYNKILQAKDAITKGSLFLLDPAVIAADALNLGYLIDEISEVLIEILNELKPDYYAGTYPPQRSYESQIKESELFAFRWVSEKFGCDTYFKFALNQENLWIVSLHEHREKQGG